MRKRKRQRGYSASGLAFLDVMSCGFGAAVLVFMLVKHNIAEQAIADSYGGSGPLAGASTIETIEKVIEKLVSDSKRAAQESAQLDQQMSAKRIALAQLESKAKNPGDAETEALKQQLKAKQAALQKAKEQGAQNLAIRGDVKRQYLTGLNVEGKRIAIVADRSASMSDDEIVNIVRNQYLPASERRKAGKWRWSMAILRWVLAHLPRTSQYQVLGFNDKATSLTPNGWVKVSDGKAMQKILSQVKTWAPEKGTDLQSAFARVARMRPRPDNIYLITDGLPTLRKGATRDGRLVSPAQRIDYFQRAVRELPTGIAVHVILLPTKGDPSAPGAYWDLAANTGGRFLAPAWDWP